MAKPKPIPAKITARWLKSKGACSYQVRIFRSTFPYGVTRVTAADVRRALKAGLKVRALVGVISGRGISDCACVNCGSGPDPRTSPTTVARVIRNAQKVARNA